ncbi:MAG: amidohydrolase family protein [Lachnospiraceae bacterium]
MFTISINTGTIIDVKNRCSKIGSIGIKDGFIAEISNKPLLADIMIDATGLIVAPGFIDPHAHVDGDIYAGELSACQGITTTVGGNCGLSPLNIQQFFEEQKKGFPINQAELIGHTFTLRKAVGLSDVHEPADKWQIETMVSMANEALLSGACGVSLGLDYAPGSSLEEITRMAEVSAKFHKVCPVHSRLFTQNDLLSLYELFSVQKKTGVRMLLSHFVYQYCAGGVDFALKIVDEAIKKGLDLHIDSGMYTNWATYIGTATYEEANLRDNNMKFADMIVATGVHFGRRMDEKLYSYMRKNCPQDSVIYCEGRQEDVYKCLLKPYASPSTDIGAYGKGEGHPQIAGSFPKYIKEMVCEHKLLTIEEAVYKASLLPAQLFGFKNKGEIGKGMDADLVIFDLDTISDKAQFPDCGRPDEKPEGIPYVIVNGAFVVRDGVYTGAKPGGIIRI